jgi:hypothetical protein
MLNLDLDTRGALEFLVEKSEEILGKMEKITYANALKCAYHARQVCPIRTGRLKESIRVEAMGDGEYDAVAGGITVMGRMVDYAIYVEYGTSRFVGRFYMEHGKNETEAEFDEIVRYVMETAIDAPIGIEESEVPILGRVRRNG